MKVIVEQDKCLANGLCVMHAGDVFDQRDDDGVVVLLDEHPTADKADAVHQAVAFCPAQAIHLEE